MILQNNKLKISVDTRGAELQSVRSIDGREFIWQADPQVWPRHAPILFPIVGRLKDNAYVHQDQKYTLNQHGFARDLDFEVIKWNPSELVYSLKSNLGTYPNYPFDFDFQVGYELLDNAVVQSFMVKNMDEEVLPFSLGAHPAFAAEPIGQHLLEFEMPETASSDTVEEGIRTGEMRDVFEGNRIQLNETLFDKDALIFTNLKSSSVILKTNEGLPVVKMEYKDFPYMGIWSKPTAGYVCIEPWCGVADALAHNGNLADKEGVIFLEPGETFRRQITMTFFVD
ncbi:MAG: aldose 1-epimerase family protein [Bacteroidia bacterium]|nr:aldose 1-epimerase family protein [Bacteroidia bacterium]